MITHYTPMLQVQAERQTTELTTKGMTLEFLFLFFQDAVSQLVVFTACFFCGYACYGGNSQNNDNTNSGQGNSAYYNENNDESSEFNYWQG